MYLWCRAISYHSVDLWVFYSWNIRFTGNCKDAGQLNQSVCSNREVRGLQQAECRAWVELERLQSALDEHNLELRVKAANEAEAACQQKLTAVEAEIAELRQSLEASYK